MASSPISTVMGAFNDRDGFVGFDAYATATLEKYDSEWYEAVNCRDWGREWDGRVYLWLCGMEYAYNALKSEGKLP